MRTESNRDGSILRKPLCLNRKSTLRIRAKCFRRAVKVAKFDQESPFVPKRQRKITISIALYTLTMTSGTGTSELTLREFFFFPREAGVLNNFDFFSLGS